MIIFIINVLRIILGILLTLFIPGYLLSLFLIKKIRLFERILISIGLSIIIVSALAVFLTLISIIFGINAINEISVWLSLAFISIIFMLIFLVQKKIYKAYEMPRR